MKKRFLIAVLAVATVACSDNDAAMNGLIENVGKVSGEQCLILGNSLEQDKMPKTFESDSLVKSSIKWWCSGFFPGTCWYSYLLGKNEKVKAMAEKQTAKLLDVDSYYTHHDIGFQVMCSAGMAYKVTGDSKYLPAIYRAAQLLASRYSPVTGTIKSWDDDTYSYPVIIDNMMNLELLTFAAEKFNDPQWKKIACSHADITMKNHFRPDGSSYHMVEYNPLTGEVVNRRTVQGYSDESAWSRGQSWGLYGYTMMYRETGEERYLDHAERVAKFLLPFLEKDPVPAWDFNAPDSLASVKDASAGAVMASAFVELSALTRDAELSKRCLKQAQATINALGSKEYFAGIGEIGGFLLKHSTGFYFMNSEVDVPLTYADYYFMEALWRYKNLSGQMAAPAIRTSHPRLLATDESLALLKSMLAKAEFKPLMDMHGIEMAAADSAASDHSVVGYVCDEAHKRLLPSYSVTARAIPCIYAAAVTGEKKYLDRAIEFIDEICSYQDWNPSHFLDAARLSLVCSLAYDWLYDDLSDEIKSTILDNLKEKLIIPSEDPQYSWMPNKLNNWNQVCNGALVAASIVLADREPVYADKVIKKALNRNRPSFESMLAPDGVYPEGPCYMNFGLGWEILLLSSLESAYGTDFGIGDVQGFDKAGWYRLFSVGPTGQLFNFSDNLATDSASPMMWYLANRFGDNGILYGQEKLIAEEAENFTFPDPLYPMYIIQASQYKGGQINSPQKNVFAANGPQPLVIARTGWENNDLYLGIKGGNPSIDHAHMDAGSFVFDAYGYRWASDMGRIDYAYYEKRLTSPRDLWKYTESAPRWKLYLYKNKFHNTLTINSEDHAVTGYASLDKVFETPEYMGGRFNLTNCFKAEVARVMRTAVIRDGKYLEITDDILAPEDSGCEIRWNMATPAQLTPVDDGLLLSQGDRVMKLSANGADVKWYTAPADASKDGCASWDWTPKGLSMCGFTCSLKKNERVVIIVTIVPNAC